MNNELKELAVTLKEMQGLIDKDCTTVSEIITRLSRFIRSVYGDRKTHMTGEQLRLCLEDAFSISILLFSMIDTDVEGVDDRIASELSKLKIKYLGQ